MKHIPLLLLLTLIWIPFTTVIQIFRCFANWTLNPFENLPKWMEKINDKFDEII